MFFRVFSRVESIPFTFSFAITITVCVCVFGSDLKTQQRRGKKRLTDRPELPNNRPSSRTIDRDVITLTKPQGIDSDNEVEDKEEDFKLSITRSHTHTHTQVCDSVQTRVIPSKERVRDS